ncbi:MAG: RNA 3'-terminal phosphate cyclase, partial [bacterium]
MITIDGSFGEGGGQILRSALTLSAVTSTPFTIKNIRANRAKPGLKAQHLKSIAAAGSITKAHIEGNHLESSQIFFEPRELKGGEYRFEIGTAGSTALVLQTIFLPLSLAKTPSRVSITGGTHVAWAPCYHYLELQWLPFMQRLGFKANLNMKMAGFYPQGGGEILSEIQPVQNITSLKLLNRGKLKTILGVSAFANLNPTVAERQKIQTEKILQQNNLLPAVEINKMPARGKNTMMLLLGRFEYSQCCYFSLGARGKPAETVATESALQFLHFMNTSGVIDEYLADQILIPLVLSDKPSAFRVP